MTLLTVKVKGLVDHLGSQLRAGRCAPHAFSIQIRCKPLGYGIDLRSYHFPFLSFQNNVMLPIDSNSFLATSDEIVSALPVADSWTDCEFSCS